jgi:hypothetical protein
VEIEDYLRGFHCDAPTPRLRRRVLAAARPWRPWYLAAAAAVVLVCAGVNAWSAARFERWLGSPADALPAGSPASRLSVSTPASVSPESLIAVRRIVERDLP